MTSITYLHNGKRCTYSQRPAWSYRAERRNAARRMRAESKSALTVSRYMDLAAAVCRWHSASQRAVLEG